MNLAREARVTAKLTLEEASKKIGIGSGFLSQIERGERNPDPDRARKIAEVYGKTVDDIFTPIRYAVRNVEGGGGGAADGDKID